MCLIEIYDHKTGDWFEWEGEAGEDIREYIYRNDGEIE
jgi:hypothetical protein